MRKYEITLTDKSVIIAHSEYTSILTLPNELENKAEFITIGDTLVRKAEILSIREVKNDE